MRTREALIAVALALALAGCEGDGDERPGFIVQAPVDPRCTPIGGAYPSGLDQLPGDREIAVVMRFSPAGLLAYDVGVAPPRLLTVGALPPFPADSDGDGVDDALRHRQLGLCPGFNPQCITYPSVGSVHAAADDLVLVTTSDYEQVLFYEPLTGELQTLEVHNPIAEDAHDPDDWPFLPDAGTTALRTAISSRSCVYPPVPLDSHGDAIVPDPLCDPARVGYLTRFTAASLVADDWLFVATSNLRSPSRALFHPGTVLVYALDTTASPARTSPDTQVPVVFTSAFNPTGLTLHRNAAGRALILVTLTGPIDAGGGIGGAAAVDVIDVETAELVATIPLGEGAAPSFGPMAVDPSGRIALLGAESQRQLYAVDLRPLDDAALYAEQTRPVVLDGNTPGFPDARIFDAETPLRLPDRPDGPPRAICPPRTNVAIAASGEIAHASDWCDGNVHVLALDLSDASEQPLDPARIQLTGRVDVLAPKDPDLFGLLTAPSMVRTTPVAAGVDPERPDVFLVANEPESQLCALRISP